MNIIKASISTKQVRIIKCFVLIQTIIIYFNKKSPNWAEFVRDKWIELKQEIQLDILKRKPYKKPEEKQKKNKKKLRS